MDGYVKKHRVGRSSHGAREKAELAYAKERFDNLVLSFMVRQKEKKNHHAS